MKNLILSAFATLLLTACETGYKAEENSTIDAITPDKSHPAYIESELLDEDFSGGRISDGLDIGTIRVSYKGDSTRIVFDSYQWNQTSEYLGEKVNKVGAYDFNYNPDKLLITATINGYRGFSAALPKFSRDSVVEKMYLDEYLDDSGYKFYIKLKFDAKVKIFDLNNPGRIVMDISSF